jgi:hypothetical protein
MEFSSLDIDICSATSEFEAIAEADIREAHGEIVARPILSGVPEYVYVGSVHSQDEDQKAFAAEIDAQCRASDEY